MRALGQDCEVLGWKVWQLLRDAAVLGCMIMVLLRLREVFVVWEGMNGIDP